MTPAHTSNLSPLFSELNRPTRISYLADKPVISDSITIKLAHRQFPGNSQHDYDTDKQKNAQA